VTIVLQSILLLSKSTTKNSSSLLSIEASVPFFFTQLMSASYQQCGVFTTEKHERPPNIAEKPSGQVAFKKKKRENQNGTLRVAIVTLWLWYLFRKKLNK